MDETPMSFDSPRFALWQTEMLRAGLDTAGFLCELRRLRAEPAGDGHHVLVLPGLMAGDPSTYPLRQLLWDRGYQAHSWRQGVNIGPTLPTIAGLTERLEELWQRGDGKVSLVGWSLGGILARELARLHPEKVRCVITLGSPFRLTVKHSPYTTHAGLVYHALRPWHTDLLEHGLSEEELEPLQMPATAIYSRWDGIVPWRACRDLPGERRENIEVSASHLGLGVQPDVLRIVLDRLAQQPETWQPYRQGQQHKRLQHQHRHHRDPRAEGHHQVIKPAC